MKVFDKSFTQQPPIGDAGIAAAVEVMRSGRLHRYNTPPDTRSETDLLEAKATESGARFLLLSHMRGHMTDMERITALCERLGIYLIEDCAHTMGASWRGRKSGSFGRVACFSTQTYKHANSGEGGLLTTRDPDVKDANSSEGGLLTTRDPDVMARAIVLSGSYMLFDTHGAEPPEEAFEQVQYDTPNYSGRMDNLRAAILRPQLADLEVRCERWTQRYRAVEGIIGRCPSVRLPVRTDRILATLLDMRIPLTFTEQDCRLIGEIIVEVITECSR
ncbi:MAG: hypothetical protein GY929_05320 [Actinomycetia bacterium]|nr:hypothetical protein [Actinomycetes bacterium]